MAVLGSLRTGYQTVYIGSVYGRRRWDICIDEYFEDPAAYPGSFRIRLERDLRLQYGASQNDLWSGALASALRIRVIDFGFSLYNRFINARIEGGDDTTFRLRLRSGDGLYRWEGYVRLDTADRVQSLFGGPPITEVYAYDGTADLSNLPDFESPDIATGPPIGNSLHAFFRDKLSYMIAPLDIEYRSDIRADNMQAGPAMPRLSFSRIKGSSFTPKEIDLQTKFEMALRGLLVRAWQGLSSGRWHVAGPHLMGIDLEAELFSYVDYAPDRIDQDEVTFIDAGSRAYPVAPNAIGMAATVGVYGLFSRLEISRETPFSGYDSGFHQGFTFTANRWNANTYMYGTQSGAVNFDSRGQFAASMRIGLGGEWDLERQIFDAGEAVYFNINMIWMGERVAGSGEVAAGFKFWVEALEDGDSDYYLVDDGTWTTIETTIATEDFTPDANAADPLTEHEAVITSIEPIPVKGRLHFTATGEASGKNDNILITRLGIRPVTSATAGEFDDGLSWNTTYRRLDEAGSQVPGDTLSVDTEIVNLARFATANRDGHINVFNEATGLYIQAGKFLRAGNHLTAEEADLLFADLSELWASVIMSESTARLRRFTGPIRGLWPPELIPVIDCVPYVWLDGEMDLVREITEARWAQKPGTYTLQS